jgi:hypothetical protein
MKRHILPFMLGVFIALATANVASAQGLTDFPMVGITHGQTIHINLSRCASCLCPPAKLGFQNSNGVAVGPSETVTLAAGQTRSLAFSPTIASGIREELLPTVVVPAGSDCVASVEVISSNETLVLVPGAPGFSLNPVFGALGLTTHQTARLNVVAYPPNPCAGVIGFEYDNGVPAGTSKQVNLATGHATFLDFPSPGNLRTEVRPVVSVSGGACVASAEVYETATGVTTVIDPSRCAGCTVVF